jgi:aryl-alcohol dehydrogenase-like predicted oxidoreductase
MPAALALGTAQFGARYGVANAERVSRAEVAAMLAAGEQLGVSLLDTAPAYGDAEALLGELGAGGGAFRVVSKLAASATPDVRAQLASSLARLRAAKLYALLEHRPANLLGPDGAARFAQLARLREEGRIEKLGASVYTRAEIDALLARFPLDVIQLPLSILDQRLLHDGTLARLRARGVEVHARSVLLQGALALAESALPAFLAPLAGAIARVEAEARARGISRVALALAFSTSLPEVDCVVVGAASRGQLAELAAAARLSVAPGELASLAIRDERLLDPSRWPAP